MAFQPPPTVGTAADSPPSSAWCEPQAIVPDDRDATSIFGRAQVLDFSASCPMGNHAPPAMRVELVSAFTSECVKAVDFDPRGSSRILCGMRGRGVVWLVDGEAGCVIQGYDVDTLQGASALSASDAAAAPRWDSGLARPASEVIKTLASEQHPERRPAWDSTVRVIKFLPFVDAFVCGTESGTMYVVDIAAGELVAHVEKGRNGDIRAIAVHPTERVVLTAGDDKKLYIWSYGRWPVWECLRVLPGHDHYTTGLALHPESTLQRLVCASTSYDTSLRLWALDCAPTSEASGSAQFSDPNDKPPSWSDAQQLSDARPSYTESIVRLLSSAETTLDSTLRGSAFVATPTDDELVPVPSTGGRRRSVRFPDTPKRSYRLVVVGAYCKPDDSAAASPIHTSPGASVEADEENHLRRHAPVKRGPAIHILQPHQHVYSPHDGQHTSIPPVPFASIDATTAHATSVCSIPQFPGVAAVTSEDARLTFVHVGSADDDDGSSPSFASCTVPEELVGRLANCVEVSHTRTEAPLIAVGTNRGLCVLRLSRQATNDARGDGDVPRSIAIAPPPQEVELRPWVPASVIRHYARDGNTLVRFEWANAVGDNTRPPDALRDESHLLEERDAVPPAFGCFSVSFRASENTPVSTQRFVRFRPVGDATVDGAGTSTKRGTPEEQHAAGSGRSGDRAAPVGHGAVFAYTAPRPTRTTPALDVPVLGEPTPPATAEDWLLLGEELAPSCDWAAFGHGNQRLRVNAWTCADRALAADEGHAAVSPRVMARAYVVMARVLARDGKSFEHPALTPDDQRLASCSVYCGRRRPLTAKLCLETALGLDWHCGGAWLLLASWLQDGRTCRPLRRHRCRPSQFEDDGGDLGDTLLGNASETAPCQSGDASRPADSPLRDLDQERKKLDEKTISGTVCAAEAVRCLRRHAGAWRLLLRRIGSNENVDVGGGHFVGSAEVAAELVTLDPRDGQAWHALSGSYWPSSFVSKGPRGLDDRPLVHPLTGSTVMTQQECEAIARDIGYVPPTNCFGQAKGGARQRPSWIWRMLGY